MKLEKMALIVMQMRCLLLLVCLMTLNYLIVYLIVNSPVYSK